MAIYFLQLSGVKDRVKIGKAKDVDRRLYELRRFPSSAWKDAAEHEAHTLELAAVVEGYSQVEAAIHRLLAPARLHGEWFNLHDKRVRDLVGMVNDHGDHVFAILFPDALKMDRRQACPHADLRAAHPSGACVLCEETADDGYPFIDDKPDPALGVANRVFTDRAIQRFNIAEKMEPLVRDELIGQLLAELGDEPERVSADRTVREPDSTDPTLTAAVLLGTLQASTPVHDEPTDEERDLLEQELAAQLEEGERELAMRDLSEFFRQAVDAGLVHGISKLEWAPHLEATCTHVQLLIEGQLVAMCGGPQRDGTFTHGVTQEMIDKQVALWSRHNAEHVANGGESIFTHLEAPWFAAPLVQNMIENLCPGTLKSTVAMVIANAWVWLKYEGYMFGAASWLDKNVDRDSDATRELVISDWYRKRFGVKWVINPKSDAKGLWTIGLPSSDGAFKTLGGRLSRTMQSGFTGQHVHGVFIDDPDDAQLVWQDAKRNGVHDKFTMAMENRKIDERTSIIFILQQRVHVDDLTGYLLGITRWRFGTPEGRKGWAWLVIPLRFGRGPRNAPKLTPYFWGDWRTEPDECMHPTRFTPAVIADKQTKMFEHGMATQYDQNAEPLTGGLYDRQKARWFIYEDEQPMLASLARRPDGALTREASPPIVIRRNQWGRAVCDAVLISVDCTFGSKRETASQVGLVAYGILKERLLVLEDRTRRMSVQEHYDEIIRMICDWAPTVKTVLVEEKALGEAVVNAIETALKSGEHTFQTDRDGKQLPIGQKPTRLLGQDKRPVRVTLERIKVGSEEGKMIRARAAMPTWDGGFTYLHDGAPWLYIKRDASGKEVDAGYFGEVTLFPFAKKNDRIDTFSQCVDWVRENGMRLKRAMALNVL